MYEDVFSYEDIFSERLAQLRSKKGVTAREMSLSLGQNESYINRIENKKNLPSMTTFFYICEYLEITPQAFFDVGNENPQLFDEIMQNLIELDSHSLEQISGIVRTLAGK